MEPAHVDNQRVVVLSPHPDDAVFSAWDVLRHGVPGVVITVFAGVPEPGFVTALDELHGATDSAEWAGRRRREDAEAIARSGCRAVHVGLLDLAYRMESVPELREQAARDPGRILELGRSAPQLRVDPDAMGAAIGDLLAADSLVYAPAGAGGHPDHQDVARYAVALARQGRAVRLYADSPYYLRDGLPSWFTGTPDPRADDVSTAALEALDLDHRSLARRTVRLSDADVDAKLTAMRAYRTEFDPVDADFGGIAADPEVMRHETYWTL